MQTRRIGKEMREIQQLLHHKIESIKSDEPSSLTHIQVHLLLYISKQRENVYQKDLEKYMKVRRSTATQMLKVLERDGYIMRTQDEEDARLKVIKITQKTRLLIDQMDKHMTDIEKMLRKNVDIEDLETFFKVVDQIKINLE